MDKPQKSKTGRALTASETYKCLTELQAHGMKHRTHHWILDPPLGFLCIPQGFPDAAMNGDVGDALGSSCHWPRPYPCTPPDRTLNPWSWLAEQWRSPARTAHFGEEADTDLRSQPNAPPIQRLAVFPFSTFLSSRSQVGLSGSPRPSVPCRLTILLSIPTVLTLPRAIFPIVPACRLPDRSC
jgi:hypothetical protein